jgi:hypothetical protein
MGIFWSFFILTSLAVKLLNWGRLVRVLLHFIPFTAHEGQVDTIAGFILNVPCRNLIPQTVYPGWQFCDLSQPSQDNYNIIPEIANDSVISSIIIPFDLIFNEHLTLVISLSRPVFHKEEILQTSMVWSPWYVIAAPMLPIYGDSISKNRHVM